MQTSVVDQMQGRKARRRCANARVAYGFVLAALLAWQVIAFAASEIAGQVTFGGLPVPGATVTATRGDTEKVVSADTQGVFRVSEVADGEWTVKVEMLGFAPLTRMVTVPDAPATWDLTLLPFDDIARNATRVATPAPAVVQATPASSKSGSGGTAASGRGAAPPASSARATPRGGFQRAAVNAAPGANAVANAPPPEEAQRDSAFGGGDAFLVNGSVNNGAASPFAQAPRFGNNVPGSRSLFNYGLGITFDNSALDTRPYSFTSDPTPKPSYNDAQVMATFAGPVKMPHWWFRNRLLVNLGYQRTSDHNATTQPGRMPTLLERSGDFSQSTDAFGRPISIVDPETGKPFAGNQIPAARIAPQTTSLLQYYPLPNLDPGGRYNYQIPLLVTTHSDNVQTRLTQSINGKNQLFATIMFQRTSTESANMFGFVDVTRASGVDTTINWTHRFSPFVSLRTRYQFTRLSNDVTPFFAGRTNVSGDAGISGNNQEPPNWGPPTLVFSSIEGLGTAQAAVNTNLSHGAGAETIWSHGRHTFTIGGDLRLTHYDVISQQDARGTFTFTGGATGSDLADFMLGLPHASSIAYGNADKYLRGGTYDAYITDDWRLSPALTLNVGARWEYESPYSEVYNRLVNLDVAPGFKGVAPVVASQSVGSVTGQSYPSSLVRPDRLGIQPRLGMAWRPVPGSSLVVRGGYGVYRNTSVYQSIAMMMAQQPPLSKTLSVETSPAAPLTLANGFITSPGITPNTFAIDPDFRVGYVHNWQALVQRDLPASLAITASYLGTAGRRLMQEFLPNTYPLGAVDPCPTCPTGFVYLTSNGTSSRHAGQVQVRRRLRNGLAASVQYTLSKATDNAAAFSGASLSGLAIAQNWLDLNAEYAPSNFDQRHLVTAQVQYTTGVGVSGGTLVDGLRGTLLKGWTFTSQVTAGSGLPVTPVYLTTVSGTGVTGTVRASTTGISANPIADESYANPLAFAPPAAGQWGTAGRNSIRGPAVFTLNGSMTRTFQLSARASFDWRIDASNLFNTVTYTNIYNVIGGPQFGLPQRANTMRKIQSTIRFRF